MGLITSQGNNLIGETDGSTGWVGSDLTGTMAAPLNSLLASLGNYGGPTQTMALLPGSPALDGGNNALIPGGVTTDQRGLPGIVNGKVDVGAFESSGFTIAATSGSGQTASGTFPAPLVATVTANNPIEPVAGGLVAFIPPASGASAGVTSSPATIGASGTASVTATSNAFGGSYTISATASGVPAAASFSLTKRAPVSIALSPGNPVLDEGVTGQLTATGTFADGSTQDISKVRDLDFGDPVGGHDQRHRCRLGRGPGNQRDHRDGGGRHQPRRHLDRDRQLRGQHHRRRLRFLERHDQPSRGDRGRQRRTGPDDHLRPDRFRRRPDDHVVVGPARAEGHDGPDHDHGPGGRRDREPAGGSGCSRLTRTSLHRSRD